MPQQIATGADFRGQGNNAGKGNVYADNFIGAMGVVDSAGVVSAVLPVYAYIGSATLAELNAGKVLIPDIPGRTIKVVGYLLKFTGGFTTATDIRLQDNNDTPVLITTVLIAAATTGAKITSEAVIANVTDGAGLFANLTLGKGIKIVKTGSSAAAGTSILVKILYNVI